MNNNKITAGTFALLTMLVVVATTTMTTAAVYAQLPQEVPDPEEVSTFEASPEAARFAIGIATGVLWDLTDTSPYVSFSDDGTMHVSKGFNTETGFVSISVSATHNLTAANGYVYDNDTITAPNGTQVFP